MDFGCAANVDTAVVVQYISTYIPWSMDASRRNLKARVLLYAEGEKRLRG